MGRQAAGIGRESLIRQINHWHDAFPGAVRRIAAVDVAGDLLADGLLEYYQASRLRYGTSAIAGIRSAMASASLSGETVSQTFEKIAKVFRMPQWRAERIVRTEQSFATHRRQVEDMRDVYGEDVVEWRKQLIAVVPSDGRTGLDSLFVHGQTRKIDEPFRDNQGRVYMHPPNRPNDRETLVMVPAPARRAVRSRAA